jgi:hypothetical protein
MHAYLSLRGTQLRVTLTNLTGQRGLGVCALIVGLELMPTAETPPFAGTRMLLQGQLYIGPESGGMHYVGHLHTTRTIVFPRGPVTTTDIAADLSAAQLKAVEDARQEKGLTLTLNVHGLLLFDGETEPFDGQLQYMVDAATWGRALEQCGYGQLVVAHLPSEGPAA